ncbi:calmodulin-lysine N-methyltransferase isoform X2 [Phoenix dactylifera]|uniref:Calmodulin-lysine N-methyltransferase n=1 Tax=Phoenix dactylifera TaxID=42345 RepID=A0A8B8J4D3_PHODC|nr:calmodulin-lysine N-methyltransferase isoform X2 [Phoenix dactylifera]
MEKASGSPSSPASLRWEILRRSFLSRSSPEPDHASQKSTKIVSRKAAGGFKLISCHPLRGHLSEDLGTSPRTKDLAGHRDVCICYKLPVASVPNLTLVFKIPQAGPTSTDGRCGISYPFAMLTKCIDRQRMEDCIDLNDFQISTGYSIDTTGLVCCWPSEDVLAYFCISHLDMFRSKRVLELGSGYGLAGLAIAASSDACEVVISDGNPQVVDYIQRNISVNAGAFGNTKVKSMTLHWNEEPASDILNSFDIIVASDCTFFKEFHESLARIVKSLLKYSEGSEAIFLSPKRGDSLDKFLENIMEAGLQYELVEKYDSRVWNLHQNFLEGRDTSWPNYLKDHCYPLLVKITHHEPEQPCHLSL